MKSYYLFLIVLLTGLNLFSQETETNKKWRFGVELFPNFTNFLFTTNNSSFIDYSAFLKEHSSPKFCFSGQVYASKSMNEKSSISIGLGYQNIGSKYGGYNNSGIQKYNHHNIQIPILYSYNFTKKIFIQTGISPTINFLNTMTYEKNSYLGEAGKPEKLPDDYRRLNYSYNIGVGFILFSLPTMDLYTQANIETTILKINPYSIVKQRPVSVGLVIGAKF